MGGGGPPLPLSSFIPCIHLVDIVFLSIPDTGLVAGGMRSGKENGRKINRKTNRLIFEGISSCFNHSAIITEESCFQLYSYFLLKMPCPHYLLFSSYVSMFTVVKGVGRPFQLCCVVSERKDVSWVLRSQETASASAS